MSPKKKEQTALEEALRQTAQRLREISKTAAAEDLLRAARLAILRRQLFCALYRRGAAFDALGNPDEPGRVAAWWEYCAQRACPLLPPALDAQPPLHPQEACARAILPPGMEDLGQTYQELREVQLSPGAGGALTLSRARSARRLTGLFFTPDWIASRLAAMALDWLPADARRDDITASLQVMDPACGSGRLLLACLERLLSLPDLNRRDRAETIRELAPAVLRGVDIDPVAAALARSQLWIEADPSRGALDGLDRVIFTGDALTGPIRGPGHLFAGEDKQEVLRWEEIVPAATEGRAAGFDVVVGNPPFEVLKGFSSRPGLRAYVERIRQSGYDLALSGNLNTYRLFLERSLQLLAPGGRLALVLPFGFLMDRSAAPLRRRMLRGGWIDQVVVYPESSRVFRGVGQSVVLLAAQKSERRGGELAVLDGTHRAPPTRIPREHLAVLDPENMPIPVAREDAYLLAVRMRRNNRSSLGDLARGRVGEVDQTFHRRFIKNRPAGALLLRGAHLAPYRASLDTARTEERWLEQRGFEDARGAGGWKQDLRSARVVQTGIVNLEAARRLVAAEVPPGVFLGNSLNYWVPIQLPGFDGGLLRGYLLGLLNSTPLEWRFRLTSSNNNVNLYEVRALPLPGLAATFPAERISPFLEQASGQLGDSSMSVPGAVRQIISGGGSPQRDDRAAAMLIGQTARRRAAEEDPARARWLDAVIDHLVNWHLGNDDADLEIIYRDVPARAFEE